MKALSVREGTLLWEPSEEFKARSTIKRYMAWLKENKGLDFNSYNPLWEWSVTSIEEFWESMWEFFELKASKPYAKVLSERKMPGARWFLGAELNLAEHVFRMRSSNRPAIIFKNEVQSPVYISWDELYSKVASVAATLRNMGIKPGDRIVAYMPYIPETTIAFLASASIGAVWAICSPDFGSRSVVDRFKQIEPNVLFATDGYTYGGKPFDRLNVISDLQRSLPSLQKTVLVPYMDKDASGTGLDNLLMWEDIIKEDGGDLVFEQVPFNHPLWVVYSSGTTGLPKAIVQGHGGILIEQFKFWGIHCDLKPDDTFFWYSTTGWIVYNIGMCGLLLGATCFVYDGNPGYPDMDLFWRFAEDFNIAFFGTGAPFLHACMRAGMEPGKIHNLSALSHIASSASPLSPDGFRWVYEKVKSDVLLGSTSGGTDICSGLLGACPLLPVRAGELQCPCLGVKVESFDENGNTVIDQVGELVVTEPMPSMPLFLWNDPDYSRYNDSYFDLYPGIWRHGDWIKIKPDLSSVIYGRSDSTLKRMGVRMGSSEIYSAVEELPEVIDSLIVGYDTPDGGYFMPMFVVLKEGISLDDTLKAKIKQKIHDTLSPRHVPDEIFAAPAIPRTLNFKKLEVPVKKILTGVPVNKAVNVDSMNNPESIAYFIEMYSKLRVRDKG